MTLHEHISGLVERCREWLGLDHWTLRVETGAVEGATAACSASPEYREATLSFDFDKMRTGEDPAELVSHEMAHCHVWPIHAVAEHLANALAESAPEHLREPLTKLLQEQVREAAERTTTDVGHTYLRLLRRAGVLDTPAANS